MKVWNGANLVHVIMTKGSGNKAYCAGGDVTCKLLVLVYTFVEI